MGSKNVYERFVWFDHQVRSKKYPNATALANHFEVSSKTAQRDIDFMRDRLFCPLHYDRSRKGYYYTDETFSLPMIYLSSEELSSLLIARKILQDISGGPRGPEITSIVNKITNLLQRHSIAAGTIDDAFSFHFIEYSPAPEAVFKTVLEGCLKRRRLNITYYSPASGEEKERTVEPYHLLNYMGTWHLIGLCHLRGEVRDFALNRILKATVLTRSFKIPSHFNFEDYFLSTFGLYKGKSVHQVHLRFSPEKSKWIRTQVWHRDQRTTLHPDGSLEINFPVSDFSEIKREILKHGSDVEVLKPKMLRQWIESEAGKILEIYRSSH